jgi:hypothetical protein
MSVNRYQPHVLVLPEDDADRQLANGFLQDQSVLTSRIQVLPEVGGWTAVLDCFKSDHIGGMNKYPLRFMVLLIDFDRQKDRFDRARADIPAHLNGRVFILGVWSEPEKLKPTLGSYETIGSAMAKDCREGTDTIWSHVLLRHNASEIDRLREHVRPILFQSV